MIFYVLLPLAALLSGPLHARIVRSRLSSLSQEQEDWAVQDAVEERAVAAGISAEDAAALAQITEAPPVSDAALPSRRRLGLQIGASLAVVFAALVARLPSPWLLLAFCTVAGTSATLFIVDARMKRLPLAEVYACYAQAVVFLAVAGFGTGQWHPWRALASAGVWGLMFFVPWIVTLGRGVGFGDVQLAPALGLLLGWLGWGASAIGLFTGFLLGGVFGVALMVRQRATRKTAVAYGPFMLAGALIGALFGQALLTGYLTAMGFGDVVPVGLVSGPHLGSWLTSVEHLLLAQ